MLYLWFQKTQYGLHINDINEEAKFVSAKRKVHFRINGPRHTYNNYSKRPHNTNHRALCGLVSINSYERDYKTWRKSVHIWVRYLIETL